MQRSCVDCGIVMENRACVGIRRSIHDCNALTKGVPPNLGITMEDEDLLEDTFEGKGYLWTKPVFSTNFAK